MDPYKMFGVSEAKIKLESDLQLVRKRAKKLYKRYCAEKKKFDAKKVLEAFDLIKKKVKGRLGEGANKILGRSRMERMMDKHYNRQTKEIKKDKRVRKELKKARKGEERFHLPGDKERILTHKQLKHRRRRRRRDRQRKSAKQMQQKQVEVLQGLTRLAAVLEQQSKFPKAVKLVHRWMKEYMNKDNREFVFEVLQKVVEFEYLVDDPDARQDVIMVFEYVLSYFAEWFEGSEQPRALRDYWRSAAVLASQCYTDDAFILTRTLLSLSEMLKLLEEHRDVLGEGVRYEEDHKEEPKPPTVKRHRTHEIQDEAELKRKLTEELKRELTEELKRELTEDLKLELTDMKDEEDDDSWSAVEVPWPEATDNEAEAETKADVDHENGEVVKEDVVKPEYVKQEVAMAFDNEISDSDDEQVKVDGKKDVKEDGDLPMPSPFPLPSPLQSPGMIELGDSEDDGNAIDVCSAESSVQEEEISSDDDSMCELEVEVESSSSSGLECTGVDVQELEDSIFLVPSVPQSLYKLRTHMVNRCLAILFKQRGPLWARSKIDNFFQDLFYRRDVFALEQREQIEDWQARIKYMQKFAERDVGTVNNPLEAQRPVVDSREERIFTDADGGAWAAKQTFDARESAAGKVIR